MTAPTRMRQLPRHAGTLARGGFPSATLATFARSLPVPLAYRTPLRGDSHSSLHRPLRETPRIAPGPLCRSRTSLRRCVHLVGSRRGLP